MRKNNLKIQILTLTSRFHVVDFETELGSRKLHPTFFILIHFILDASFLSFSPLTFHLLDIILWGHAQTMWSIFWTFLTPPTPFVDSFTK